MKIISYKSNRLFLKVRQKRSLLKKEDIKSLAVFILVFVIFFMPLSSLPRIKAENDKSSEEWGKDSQQALTFTLLHTNDEHSALITPSHFLEGYQEQDITLGGAARLASAVTKIREEKKEEGEPVLLVSAGDFLGGSPFGWLSLHGLAPELSLMQEIGYDIVTLGNHEFDYGSEALALYLKTAGYPEAHDDTVIVASNTLIPAGHLLEETRLKETHLIELENGLRVGFFGILGRSARRFVRAASPVRFSSHLVSSRAAVQELRAQEADIVVALTHSGLSEDRELAREVSGIDIIVGGHSHTLLHEPVVEQGTLIVQAGSLLSHLGQLELVFNPSTGELRTRNLETGNPYVVPVDSSFLRKPVIEEILSYYTEELEYLVSRLTDGNFQYIMEPVAYTEFPLANTAPLQETTLGNYVTDAMRIVVKDRLGEQVDFAFQTSGQIRGELLPGEMDGSGRAISFYEMASLAGMGRGYDERPGYPLTMAYFTEGEVRRILEYTNYLSSFMGGAYFLQVSGLRYDYNPSKAALFRIPVINLPVPTLLGVQSVERFTEDGVQLAQKQEYHSLKHDGQALYSVVAGYHLMEALIIAGEFLPTRFGIVPKSKYGTPLRNIEDTIVQINGEELKVWEAVINYAMQHEVVQPGDPWIPEYYASTSGRINQEGTPSSYIWFALFVGGAFVVLIMFNPVKLLRTRQNKKGN